MEPIDILSAGYLTTASLRLTTRAFLLPRKYQKGEVEYEQNADERT